MKDEVNKLAPTMLLIAAVAAGVILRYWTEGSISSITSVVGILTAIALCAVVVLLRRQIALRLGQLVVVARMLPTLWWLALISTGLYVHALTQPALVFESAWVLRADRYSHLSLIKMLWGVPGKTIGTTLSLAAFCFGHSMLAVGVIWVLVLAAVRAEQRPAIRFATGAAAVGTWCAVLSVILGTGFLAAMSVFSQSVLIPLRGWWAWLVALALLAVVLTVNWIARFRAPPVEHLGVPIRRQSANRGADGPTGDNASRCSPVHDMPRDA